MLTYSNNDRKEEAHLNEMSEPSMQISVRNCAVRLQNCAYGVS